MSREVVGTHAPNVPYLGDDGRDAKLLAVLLFDGATRAYVAYEGLVLAIDRASVAAVASRGKKLDYGRAAEHWPSLRPGEYQR